MDELILKDFRCFPGEQRVPLKPLTVLVGENSTGKTSFLAAVRLAWGILTGPRPQDFAEPPFDLGGYRDIAFHRGTRVAREFVIGGRMGERVATGVYTKLDARIRKGLPLLSRWALEGAKEHAAGEPVSWKLERLGDDPNAPAHVGTNSGVYQGTVRSAGIERRLLHFSVTWRNAYDQGGASWSSLFEDGRNDDTLGPWASFWMSWPSTARPLALAPIRTSPQRSYRSSVVQWGPDGAHVPHQLAELSDRPAKEHEKSLAEIQRIVNGLGLFNRVEVQASGADGGTFELMVEVNGRLVNLADVGYGVSQALPLAVEFAIRPSASTFLIQQPEVHLHPRAQAALGSVFGALVKEKKQRFVVETHSDYLIDRVLLDIRDKKTIRAEDFQILYFQWENGGVKIHPIDVDAQGQLVPETVPSGYRSFFLDEQHRVWSR